ncbi:ABC transporter ATP-binding protein [Dehalococcoidia bacterium]|nr:ABC transporter ATP-binding protein [Dehalococcoidia bacterium]MCL0077327.1 ABC transporter ATP-binding protein [Dehalococcoidia bacterium]MCL0098523.1 ABC transporter ATP-binding protein [Dehalococcoidia bacterium]
MPEAILRVENLSKSYGRFAAVKEVSFELRRGEVFGFLGPNGAGKTTTIKVCTGLLKPSAGRVIIGGFDIVKQPVAAKELLGYVPDNPFLYDKLTGREFVRFVSRLYNSNSAEQRIQELFDSFEMSDKIDELIQGYSRGMRQKTALISALIHNPQVLFVDEPTANLDPRSARLAKDIFRALTKQGVSVFMSTHIMEIAERLCDRIGIIHHGELVALGTLSELNQQAALEGSTLEDVFLELTGDFDADTKKLLEELGT